MPYLGESSLQVIQVEPQKFSTDISTSAVISVYFSEDLIETTSQNLALAFKVRATEAGTAVTGTLSYLAKTIAFIPTSALATDTDYTITVVATKLTSITGSQLVANYTSSFRTALSSTVEKPTLSAPANLSMTSTTPTFTWSAVASTYNIQIAKDPGFGNVIVNSSNFSGTSFTPSNTALDKDCQYYWAVSGTGGDWSDVRTFYYTSSGATEQTLLQILSTSILTGQSMVRACSSIIVTFSEDIETMSVVMTGISVDGDEDTYVVVPTTVTTDNEVGTISFSTLPNNMSYTLVIGKDSEATSENIMSADVEIKFCTLLTPHYSTKELIRLDVGPFIEATDHEIDVTIRDVSLWADTIAEVEYNADTQQWYRCYVRYETDLRLMLKAMMGMLSTKGDSFRLGDFQLGNGNSLIPDFNMAIKGIKDMIRECEAKLRGNKYIAKPLAVDKGAKKYPYPLPTRRF